jgi:hypothetical protein
MLEIYVVRRQTDCSDGVVEGDRGTKSQQRYVVVMGSFVVLCVPDDQVDSDRTTVRSWHVDSAQHHVEVGCFTGSITTTAIKVEMSYFQDIIIIVIVVAVVVVTTTATTTTIATISIIIIVSSSSSSFIIIVVILVVVIVIIVIIIIIINHHRASSRIIIITHEQHTDAQKCEKVKQRKLEKRSMERGSRGQWLTPGQRIIH